MGNSSQDEARLMRQRRTADARGIKADGRK